MTTPITFEVEQRKRGRPRAEERVRLSFAETLGQRINEDLVFSTHLRFPNPKYQTDPVRFFEEILGVEPWSKQVEIIEAVRDHDRVAVSSGHKVSKSHTAAGLALWFFCSYPDARAIMTSTTSRQVDQILWRELRMMRARSGRCIECKEADPEGLRIPKPCPHSTLIEGDLGELARTGLKAHNDFREIVGFTARETEAVAGISGRHLLYIIDEASGVPAEIYEAIEGNRAGGAKIVLFGNPTKNEGEHFEAFHSKKHLYKTIRVSSEETPNVVSGKVLIPGLATRAWIEEKREEWGEDSAIYKVRVKGEHATAEEGVLFSLHMIGEAEERWESTPPAGRLYIGLDPAGEGGKGDETCLCARRGLKMLELRARRGMNTDQHVAAVLHMIVDLRLPREVPVVVCDQDGPIGYKVFRALDAYLEQYPDAFELVGLRASDKAIRQPRLYKRIRDELAQNLKTWMKDGGAIVEDTKLEAELHVLVMDEQADGRLKLIDKDDIRKKLGRSPDRYDALALSAWEPLSLRKEEAAPQTAPAQHDPAESIEHVIDPYAAGDAWRAR